jgi:hypothetical protein
VSFTLVFLVSVPEEPVMVMVDFPVAAPAPTSRQSAGGCGGFGLNVAVTPARRSSCGQRDFLIEATRGHNGDCAGSAAALGNRQAARRSRQGKAARAHSTVNVMVVVAFRLPEVPVMVMVDVPAFAVLLAVRVMVR